MTDDEDEVKLFKAEPWNGLPDELLPTDEECDAMHREMLISMSLNCPELLEGRSLFDDQFEIKNGIVSKTDNPFRAMRSMASKHSRIDRTELPGGGYVSTVAVVSATKGHPFETMAFGVGPFSGIQERWKTVGEAKQGHYAIVARIRSFYAWLRRGNERRYKKWWKRVTRYERYCETREAWSDRHRSSMLRIENRIRRIPGNPPTPLYWEIHGIYAFFRYLREHGSQQSYGQQAEEGD